MSAPLDDATLIARLRERFDDAKARRKPIVARWIQNYTIVNSRPWARNRSNWKPAPDIPEIFPILSSRVAWIRETSPTFDASPVADPNSPFYDYNLQLANDMKVVLDANWTQENYDPELEKLLWDGQIYGTGISSTLWDPTAAGGQGDGVMLRVDPFTFYPDPDAHNLDQCNYMFEVQRITLGELDRRFPGSADKLQSDLGAVGQEKQPDPSPSQLDDNGNPQFTALGKGGKDSTGTRVQAQWGTKTSQPYSFRPDDQVLVFFCWMKDTEEVDDDMAGDVTNQMTSYSANGALGKDDGEGDDPNGWTRPEPRQTECWRCVVFVNNTVILDEHAKDLWGHGRHPYDRYVEQEMGEFWGKSMVDLLAPSQISLNRLLAAIEHNIWLMGNPILLEDISSGISRQTITNKPGTRLRVNPGRDVKYLDPPQMQSDMAVNLLQFYIGEMERISGISGMTRGATPTGRNAQGVLDSLQEAAFVRVRLAIRNLETLLRGVGQKNASNICEFYDAPRIISLVGPTGQATALAISGKHFYSPTPEGRTPLRFQIDVEAGSSLPTSKSARMAEADTLFAMMAIDREAVLEAHNWPNRNNVLQRMQMVEAQEGPLQPGARAAAGRTH